MCGRCFVCDSSGMVMIRFSLFWGWLKSVFTCVGIFFCGVVLELMMVLESLG